MLNGLENEILTGIRVLELTKGPSGGYAGRLLAGSGALVTKVLIKSQNKSLFRDSEKCIKHTTNNRETRDVVSDLLCESWDIILWDSHSDNDLDQFLINFLSNTQQTSVGVRLDFPADVDVDEEYALQAIGGWMALTGDPGNIPLQVGGYAASYLVGAHAATAGLMALLEREWTDRGRLVQINGHSIVVSALEGAFSTYLDTGISRSRPGNRHHELTPMSILPSADGWIFAGAPVDEKWQLLESWSDIPSHLEWKCNTGRKKNRELLEKNLAGWSREMTQEELFLTGQTFRLPFAKVQTPDEVRNCPQLVARNFWKHSNANRTDIQLPWKMNTSAVPSHEVDTPRSVTSWEGLRILDLTSMWSGPYCTRLFADQGAEVIKVEAPHRPDGIRSNRGASSPFFRELNRNKSGIQLDLRLESDRQTFLGLVAVSDVLIENFSPRVMSNFGLDCEVLRKHRPDLTIVSLSAFGQTGPYRDFVGYGSTLESMSGLASLTHYSDGNPWLPGFSVSDIGAGIHGAFALVSALFFRNREGIGVRVDLSQYETACQFIGDYLIEGVVPSRSEKPVKVKDIKDLATDGELTKMFLPGGSPLLGMPWDSIGWKTPLNPPPELGEYTN